MLAVDLCSTQHVVQGKIVLIKPKNVCFGTVINNLQIGNERKSLKDKLFDKLFSII